jgi:hypothetical protein
VEGLVLARPTRSLTMYLQMVGRGLRAAPGKTHCIVIDHGHVVESLGLPQSDFDWTLDEKRNVNAETLKANASKRNSQQEALRTCQECSEIWLTSEQGHACPSCGWAPVPKSKPIAVQEAELEELADVPDFVSPTDPIVAWFYREACGWYSRRWPDKWAAKPNSGHWWAWMQTRTKFNIAESVRKPAAYWSLTPAQPSMAVSGWLHHRLIKWSRDRARATAA